MNLLYTKWKWFLAVGELGVRGIAQDRIPASLSLYASPSLSANLSLLVVKQDRSLIKIILLVYKTTL